MASQSSLDEDYYRGRALEERIAAEDATRADVAQIHEELARLYDALADHPELRPVHRPPLGRAAPRAR